MLKKANRLPGCISPEFLFWMYFIMKKFSFFSAKIISISILLVFTALFFGCKKEGVSSSGTLDKDTSYAMGMMMANQLSSSGIPSLQYDYNAFMEGFKDFNEAAETRLSWDQAIEKLNTFFTQLQAQENEKMWLEGEKNREDGEAYLADNGKRSGVTTTASGLQYEVLVQGSGEKPGSTDMVQVHYEGALIDGTVFDSSYNSGQPVEFGLNMVIPGWTEGVQLMNEGSTYRFVIPSDLAYGTNGAGPIPPNSTLVFKVELISILK